LQVVVDHHESKETGRQQLLAVHELRRNLESVAASDRSVRGRAALIGAERIAVIRQRKAQS